MPRINALPPQNSPAADDVFPSDDTSDSNNTKKVTFTKLKEWLQSLAGWITTAMVGDGQITSSKIDWAAATGKIWWEELGKTTLTGAADTITVNNLAARKYLKILVWIQISGSITITVRFNNDSGNNYGWRASNGGAADTTLGSTSGIVLTGGAATGATTALEVAEFVNIATQEKIGISLGVRQTAGAATAPFRSEGTGKWANTANQITRIDIVNTSTGDYAAGSEVIVLGHD